MVLDNVLIIVLDLGDRDALDHRAHLPGSSWKQLYYRLNSGV